MSVSPGESTIRSLLPILLTMIASLAWAAGSAMQKHGLSRRFPRITLAGFFRRFGEILRTMAANWLWLGGIVVALAGGFVYMEALSMGDLSVVQPLANMTLVFTIAIGVLLLGERLGRGEWVGIALLLVGAVTISFSAAQESAVAPGGRAQVIFSTLVFGATAGVLALQRLQRERIPIELALATGAGLMYGLSNVFIKILTFIAQEKLGAFHVLELATWRAVIVSAPALMLVLVNVAGFFLMQGAFAHGRVSLVTPVTTIVSVLVPIIAGLLLLREQAAPARLAGIGIILAGTAILAFQRRPESSRAAAPATE